MPGEWAVSRICEEFGCLPRTAVRALQRDPELIGRVLELRAFARAHERFKTEKAEDSLPAAGTDPMLDLVWEFTAERLKARGGRDDDEDDD